MYLRYYGLARTPFGPSTEPAEMFVSEQHQEALSALIYGLASRKPFVLVLGEVGVGKTTVLNAALARLDEPRPEIIRISNPLVGAGELLQLIAGALGAPESAADPEAVFRAVVAACREGRQIALVVDEAQALPPETLEVLRLLSNLQAGSQGLVQTLFVGQPEFQELIDRHQFRSLRQRIAIRAEIGPLAPDAAADYVAHCLRRAGGTPERIMTRDAVAALVRHSGGIPRRINVLADNALITGYAAETRPITAATVRAAIAAVDGRSRRDWRPALRWWPEAGAALAASLVLVGAWSLHWGTLAGPAPSTGASLGAPRAAAPPPAVVAAVVAAAPESAPEPILPVPAVVMRYELQAGDSVPALLERYYGRADKPALTLFRTLNPGLGAPERLAEGTVVTLPSGRGLPRQTAAATR